MMVAIAASHVRVWMRVMMMNVAIMRVLAVCVLVIGVSLGHHCWRR